MRSYGNGFIVGVVFFFFKSKIKKMRFEKEKKRKM